MADIKEQNLPLKTSLVSTDWIRILNTTGNFRMTVSNFQNTISLSSQRVRLIAESLTNGIDILTLDGGFYRLGGDGTYLNKPFTYGYLMVVDDSTNVDQRKWFFGVDANGRMFVKSNYSSPGTAWLELALKDSPPTLGTPTLASGWTQNSNFGAIQAKKNSMGLVTITGVVGKTTSGVAANEVIITLPAGFRPTNRLLFSCAGANGVPQEIEVTPEGKVLYRNGYDTVMHYLSFANISFQVG